MASLGARDAPICVPSRCARPGDRECALGAPRGACFVASLTSEALSRRGEKIAGDTSSVKHPHTDREHPPRHYISSVLARRLRDMASFRWEKGGSHVEPQTSSLLSGPASQRVTQGCPSLAGRQLRHAIDRPARHEGGGYASERSVELNPIRPRLLRP